jgi:hypothetical protein
MILTPEEQKEYREEIDYQIETRGHEYIWGNETAMDKTKGLLRDAPGQIIGGLQKIASNPTVIQINEKLAAHNARLCEQDAQTEIQRSAMRTDAPMQFRRPVKKPQRQPEPDRGIDGLGSQDDHL